MSELNQNYLQLASIVGRHNWREDKALLKAFTFWMHRQFGLAWQSVIFSAESMPSQIKLPITRLELTFSVGVLSSIEVETETGKYKLCAPELRPPELVRMVFLAPKVHVNGIGDDDLKEVFQKQIDRQTLSTDSGLYKKLMNDFVVTKRGKSRAARLFAKLRKDPILFFRDSKGSLGRSVYFVLHILLGREKAL